MPPSTGKVNFGVDDASLLKAYKLSALNPGCVSEMWLNPVANGCFSENGKK